MRFLFFIFLIILYLLLECREKWRLVGPAKCSSEGVQDVCALATAEACHVVAHGYLCILFLISILFDFSMFAHSRQVYVVFQLNTQHTPPKRAILVAYGYLCCCAWPRIIYCIFSWDYMSYVICYIVCIIFSWDYMSYVICCIVCIMYCVLCHIVIWYISYDNMSQVL